MRFPPILWRHVSDESQLSGETVEEFLLSLAQEALTERAQEECRREAAELALQSYELEFGPIPAAEQRAAEALWPG